MLSALTWYFIFFSLDCLMYWVFVTFQISVTLPNVRNGFCLAMRVGIKAININKISHLYISTSHRVSCCPFLCYFISFEIVLPLLLLLCQDCDFHTFTCSKYFTFIKGIRWYLNNTIACRHVGVVVLLYATRNSTSHTTHKGCSLVISIKPYTQLFDTMWRLQNPIK